MNHLEILRGAFATFSDEERANVRHHLAAGTGVLCGEHSGNFTMCGAG